jgi:hypothetical protein
VADKAPTIRKRNDSSTPTSRSLLAVGLTAGPALATNPHLKGRNPVAFSDEA